MNGPEFTGVSRSGRDYRQGSGHDVQGQGEDRVYWVVVGGRGVGEI